MRIPGLAHEYERTCNKCGYAWRVPRWAAHPHSKGLPMGARGSVVAAAANTATDNAVISANAQMAERTDAFRRCPECDSDRYKQRAVRF
jgi:hypothetical protein